MSFLNGPESSVVVEDAERISSFINNTFRHVELLGGGGGVEPAPLHTSRGFTFIGNIPEAGNCAMGGCGDANSVYAPACMSRGECK